MGWPSPRANTSTAMMSARSPWLGIHSEWTCTPTTSHERESCASLLFEDDVVSDLGKIEAPTLVVWGAKDRLCSRRDQDALVSKIRGSRLVVRERGPWSALGGAGALQERSCGVRAWSRWRRTARVMHAP